MMAKQTYILGYVIAIILILSNVKNVSANKNNQYATTTATTAATSTTNTAASTATLDGTDDPVAVSSTQQFHTSSSTSAANTYPMSKMVTVRSAVETKSISALHGRATEFMQHTLHNTSSTIDEESTMQQPHDQKEVHKQVERPQSSNSGTNNNYNNNNNQNNNNNEQQKQDRYLVQPDAGNPKQLLSTVHALSMHDLQPNPSEKWHNHAHVTQYNERSASETTTVTAPTPLSNHDEFMNENKTTVNAIESNTGITMVSPALASVTATPTEMRNAPLTEHAHPLERINDGESGNNDDSRKSDEITAMPMKMVRDNVNATSDAVFRAKTLDNDNGKFNSDVLMNARRADANTDTDDSFDPFNERSRYLETDLDEFSEPNADSENANANVNDQLDWSGDASSFEELTLDDNDDDDDEKSSPVKMQPRSWTNESPGVLIGSHESISTSPAIASTATQNILKISKPNKSKSIKRLATPPPTPQALLEIRLNKSPAMSTVYDEQFINSHSFRYITNLYDQYEWDADELQTVLTENCANDMDVYLKAMVQGKTWAARVSDTSGRYRGQFLFDNNHWLGSMVACEHMAKIDEMELSFYVATILIHSPEPMIKKHILRVGQCLPRTCSEDDVKSILNMDKAARQFTENFQNATNEMNRAEISVLAVRRVPGEYNVWTDRLFYLVVIVCIAFIGLTVWATIYEKSLAKIQEIDHENVSPSRQAIHPMHLTKAAKTNGQRIYSYENATIDLESTEPALKLDKIHTNNIINGCTFELRPISIEHNNGNHLANNNRAAAFYRLNNNNANNINNNHHASNNDDANDNNHSKRIRSHNRNGSTYATRAIDNVDHLSIPRRLLLCFGLSTNMKSVLSTKKLPQDSIGCIHGLRVFSMMWTILVHTYLQLFAVSENRYSKIITEKTFGFQILGNASYTVDTFFFISGFLVTLLFLRTKSSTKSSSDSSNNNSGSFISGTKQSVLLVIYRYIRLTPVYFMVIIINAVTLKYIYNKAVFTPGLPDHITCPNYWWRNILYIQTWFPFPQLCMLWSWYLADDMQFYVWAIVLLILSRRHGKTAVAIIIAFLLTSWIVSALVSLKFNYTHKVSEPLESFGFLYEKPWTRLGPYVMGMLAGYVLNRFKSAPAAITPFINVVLWMMSLGVMLLLVFGVWNGTLNLMWTALYVSLGHSAWGLALVWIVLSCKWGLAKPIDRLLSLRAMLPLSRLTYCAYLVHPVTQIAMSLDLKGTIHIQHGLVLTIFLGNVVTSYSVALILSLLFEAPVVRFLKVLFSK